MTDKPGALNKWRMEQFHKNNKPNRSPDKDFVCLSPSKLETDGDPNVVFLSESDQEDVSVTVSSKPKALKEVKKTRGERKRKNIVYARVSESDDSDIDYVVAQPKQKRTAKKLRIPKTRKMAVVAPITKQSLSADAVVDAMKDDSVVDVSKGDTATDVKGDAGVDDIKDDKVATPASSDHLPVTPRKRTGDLGLLDDLLNSPVVKKTQQLKDNKNHCIKKISQLPIKKDKNNEPVIQIVNNEASSDSDLSLFEVSTNHHTFHDFGRLQGPDKILHNPPPSPINAECGDYSRNMCNSPTLKFQTITPMDNGFSSDSSTGVITKKRRNKGKQPANKRKKVVVKRSKPLEEITLEPSPTKDTVNMITSDNSDTNAEKRAVTVVSPALSISLLEVDTIDNTMKDKDYNQPSVSSAGKTVEQSVNKAIVKPNSVVVIEDDDEEDDVVMLTNNERSQQEMDDLEFARRLQAQFDEENTNPAQRGAAAPSRSPNSASPVTAPLTQNSERLLQALGVSPEVSQYLGSSNRRGSRNAPAELDRVEQRLELLQQLALQNEYLDDATISEILGVPAVPPPTTTRHTGARPPAAQRRDWPRRSSPSSSANAGSSRGGEGQRLGRGGHGGSENFQRVMHGFLGLEDSEDMGYEALLELSERIGDVRQMGMSADEIDRLPARKYKQGEIGQDGDTACHICMSDFEAGQNIRTLTCFHDYHSRCIDQWLKRNATCPICRVKVSLE